MEDKIKEILRALDKEAEEHSLGFILSARRNYAHTLFEALSPEDRKEFEGTHLEYYLNKRQEKIQEANSRKIKELNQSIFTVLKDFKDRKSGKRQKARNELCKRFASQDWLAQVKILEAMVEVGTLADIEWVVARVRFFFSYELYLIGQRSEEWLEDFKRKLLEGCCKYISKPSIAAYLIETADKEFILRNQTELEKAVGYYKIAMALATRDRTFKIEREKMDFFQYLDVLAKTNRPIKKTELWDEFIVWLLSLDSEAKWTKGYRSYSGSFEAYDSSVSILDLRQVDWMIRSCKKMRLFDVVCAIYDLDNHIRELVETIPMQHYDIDLTEKNCNAYLDMAKIIAWKYQPKLESDVTLAECLKVLLDKIGATYKFFEDTIVLTYQDTSCILHFDERTNNYYFSKDIEIIQPIAHDTLTSLLAQVNGEYHKNYSCMIQDNDIEVRSEIYYFPHDGHSHVVFEAELLNFQSFYDDLTKKIISKH